MILILECIVICFCTFVCLDVCCANDNDPYCKQDKKLFRLLYPVLYSVPWGRVFRLACHRYDMGGDVRLVAYPGNGRLK